VHNCFLGDHKQSGRICEVYSFQARFLSSVQKEFTSSPLLLTIYINDMVDSFKQRDKFLYADDIKIIEHICNDTDSLPLHIDSNQIKEV
jgi:hypothetical protein